jgi:hypothetical protein
MVDFCFCEFLVTIKAYRINTKNLFFKCRKQLVCRSTRYYKGKVKIQDGSHRILKYAVQFSMMT